MKCGGRTTASRILLLFLYLSVEAFQVCLSDFPRIWKRSPSAPPPGSIVLPLSGNVYPLGYYSVSLKVGRPPKLYDLDIDTGSDLTWLQCDAPCTGCTKPRDQLYKPNNNLVHCKDLLCSAIRTTGNEPCKTPHDQCDYDIEYADHCSSLGVLVNDHFTFPLTNNSILSPRLAFGCGYNQHIPGSISPPPTAGVLGLGNGKTSIMTQLHGLGVIRNVLGHCLSTKGGGFLFFGDHPAPPSKISWVPMFNLEKHYSSGPAELLNNGKPSGVKGLEVIFDSGSSYTYFNSKAYRAILNQLRGDLNGKPLKDATDDKSLPVCWKGAKPFKSIDDAKAYFKPVVLSFTKNVQFQIPPEAYLIVTKHGNACLGILSGTEVGLEDHNVIGDISLQDKIVIYDNEKKQIGWVSANCDHLPKS
ncbi:aspartic proteinase Asp1-like isoform X2 [Punica granatum]|uniref:Aspartic proteinase Asp1 n=1 Tax=Punica granatum TaxID=22663 RepID=A0A218XK70_PUNGR|nr:aspartic proteinase Asp1-like isoform X2 [Punica granatum]XP_031391794.1 aspartic proteinase Asp1-like isoform X2 [Punica granatum]XP_031391795.1 aspartic proteinase Asp1-like isoform X2 [Punica granatum]OWM85106.1 hypothetical protein CDL15_Pgr027893 [Punica granatum]